jgi:hypothetical protein
MINKKRMKIINKEWNFNEQDDFSDTIVNDDDEGL